MRILLLLLTFGAVVVATYPVEATKPSSKKSKTSHRSSKGVIKKSSKSAAKKQVQKKSVLPGGELKTDIKFGDHDLHGQYQTPDEALASVENEKGLNDLLGVRKHFKDRLLKAAEQE